MDLCTKSDITSLAQRLGMNLENPQFAPICSTYLRPFNRMGLTIPSEHEMEGWVAFSHDNPRPILNSILRQIKIASSNLYLSWHQGSCKRKRNWLGAVFSLDIVCASILNSKEWRKKDTPFGTPRHSFLRLTEERGQAYSHQGKSKRTWICGNTVQKSKEQRGQWSLGSNKKPHGYLSSRWVAGLGHKDIVLTWYTCAYDSQLRHWIKTCFSTFTSRSIARGAKLLGISIKSVRTHSVHISFAMLIMHLNGSNDSTIMKMSRWKSAAFLAYIRSYLDQFGGDSSIIIFKDDGDFITLRN